jgi:predicted CopG family antitoxin
MESKVIKISNENYLWLLSLASELQKRKGRIISFDETINTLKNNKMENRKLSDLAGKWKMTEKEAKEFKENTKRGWKKWEIQSV